MQHADKIVERIIFLDGFPNMQVIDPLHIGQNVKEVLDCDLAAEMSAAPALYQEAATHCQSVKDYVSRGPVREADATTKKSTSIMSRPKLDLVASSVSSLYAQHHMGKYPRRSREGTDDAARAWYVLTSPRVRPPRSRSLAA